MGEGVGAGEYISVQMMKLLAKLAYRIQTRSTRRYYSASTTSTIAQITLLRIQRSPQSTRKQ